jgi:dihydroorotate dehydrogenase
MLTHLYPSYRQLSPRESAMLYDPTRKLLFLLDPERAHALSLGSLRALHRLGLARRLGGAKQDPSRRVRVMGIEFPNRLGLAAGLDKNGDYLDALGALGFGFIEVGTVTPRPQPGNPPPRLFRLPAARAIVNRMGFNNRGVDYLLARVRDSRYRGVLGINIGKNFDTPLERAADDYLIGLRKVYAHAGYVAVNISSPNTPGLRSLQTGEALDDLLARLMEARGRLAREHGRRVPLALKIAPDLEPEDLRDLAAAVRRHEVDAVIATNTTFSRQGVEGLPHAEETGGLSGAPLSERAEAILRSLREALGDELPLIGVGGIMSGADARRRIQAGADLVQVYTGFIYRGPGLVGEVLEAIESASPSARVG